MNPLTHLLFPGALSRRQLLAAGAAATLAGCAGARPSAPMTPASAANASAVAHAVALLPAQVDALLARSGVPGLAVAVVAGGQTVLARGWGVCELGRSDRVDADTVFQLASVSKSIAATVVAQQVGTGRVRWDSRMQTLLPGFALQDEQVSAQLTVGDLFAHRSGLPDHAGDVLEDLGFDQRAALEKLRQLPLTPFRSSYAYTNFGLTAGAVAVATAAGQDWATLSEQALYRPLGMTRTSSRHADFERRSNRALGHVKEGGRWVVSRGRRPDAQSPAGGVSASVNDMAKWLIMVLQQGRVDGRQVVDATALAPALLPQSQTSPATAQRPAGHYGFGFNVGATAGGQPAYSHSGAFSMGAATCFFVLPHSDVAIVALTNGWPVGLPETLCQQFIDSLESGSPQRDWWSLYAPAMQKMLAPEGELVGQPRPTQPAPARPLTDYVGRYANAYYGPLDVSVQDGRLLYTLGPARVTQALAHWDGELFVSALVGESASPGSLSKAQFAGPRLTLEFYDKDGLGTFVRG